MRNQFFFVQLYPYIYRQTHISLQNLFETIIILRITIFSLWRPMKISRPSSASAMYMMRRPIDLVLQNKIASTQQAISYQSTACIAGEDLLILGWQFPSSLGRCKPNPLTVCLPLMFILIQLVPAGGIQKQPIGPRGESKRHR